MAKSTAFSHSMLPDSSMRAIPLLLVLALGSLAHAQHPGIEGMAQREIAERDAKARYVENELLPKATEALAGKDYESAYAYAKSAVDILPASGAASSALRQSAIQLFGQACVLLAKQRLSEGRYADARGTIDVLLEDRYDPANSAALALRAQILDPQGFVDRGTLTPGHVANIEEVKKLLNEGEGYYATGRFDLAFRRCEQALNIDKYNIAARRLMEKINQARQRYADAAYNEARGDMLSQVAKAWELPVRKFTDGPSSIISQPEISTKSSQAILEKLDAITIPELNFEDASIREALAFIKKRAADLDSEEPDPTKRGINIVTKLPADFSEENSQITLSVRDVSLRAALDFVTDAVGLKVKVEPFAVVVVPSTENTDILITKEYKVPPGFIQNLPGGTGGAAGGATAGRSMAKDYLEGQGVTFPDGASANYVPTTSRLIVKNTQTNLDLVDALVDTAATTKPTQIEIEAKFLEVNQNNLNELGFDWLVGQFALAGGSGVYGSGGTEGFGRSIDSAGYPLSNPGVNGLPIGASSRTAGPVTAGNRSGTSAISLNALDAILLGSPVGPAPAALAVAGVFTNPQFQIVMRALSQQKGIDLVSAPKVTTQSGKSATIEIVREFRYPTEFDPPQLSATNGSQYTPVVPNTPTAWDTKNTGITLEVEPTVGSDSYTIDLRLAPRVIEFDGFINYGSPINATVAASVTTVIEPIVEFLLPSFTFEATPNTINQPVFSTREVETQVSVYDGQTVVIGGLMREDVQQVQDKVPILGDIPLAGRLFRSNVDQHIKRNLIMFVTASLLDPAGQPIIEVEEDDSDIPDVDVEGMLSEAIPGDVLTEPLPQ